jgi:hypothetical protein
LILGTAPVDHSTDMSLATLAPARQGRFFTLRRANRALVFVRRVIADVVVDYSQLLELQEILELEQRYGSIDYISQVKEEMSAAVTRLHGYLEELAATGVELRDFARGLVDFPARVRGREIFFCWQFGEDAISYWHYPDECLAERKPVSQLTTLQPAAGASDGSPRRQPGA